MNSRLRFPTRLPLAAAAMLSLAIIPFPAHAAEKLSDATRAKAIESAQSGLKFLEKQQNEKGYWSTADMPGLSGLVVQAFLLAPKSALPEGSKAAEKGLDFIRSAAKPDGGIYNKGMANYNTSIAMSTLLRADQEKDTALIEAAHKFLAGGQNKDDKKPSGKGGFGYEPGSGGRSRPDLDNTVYAVEAMALYREKHQGEEPIGQPDLDWQGAIDFVSRCQNLKDTNSAAWASDAPEEKGGFTYSPDGSQDGTHSYGTMTYSGLLSLVHAKVKADDPRVKAAVEWLSKRYSVEENPGLGNQGLYYYYFVMAKTLKVAGIDELESGGKKANWREELAEKLIALQKKDGSWANENGRWMENDPVLVTAYTVLALGALCAE